MRRYRNLVVTLGIMAAAPGIALGGPLSFLKPKDDAAQSRPTAAASTRPTNQQVAENIAAALRAAKLNGFDIEIEYTNGVARLTGKISNASQRVTAAKVVSRVPGVQQVDNQLIPLETAEAPKTGFLNPFRKSATTADYVTNNRPGASPVVQIGGTQPSFPASAPAAPSNQEVAEKLAEALSTAELNSYDIEIRYQDGQAMLTGSVANAQQYRTATKVAYQVAGIKQVNNQLKVLNQRQPKPPKRPIAAAGYQPGPGAAPAPPVPPGAMPAAGSPPPGYGPPGRGVSNTVYDLPNLPPNAWPSYAAYPNYAQVAYPKQYSASAWPYIGPFYPYPQVPLGWRKVSLEWDDGYWNLDFDSRTDRWWWFLNPKNW